MLYKILILFLLIPLSSLFSQEKNEYPDYIGDIEFNKATDREDFELCPGKRIYQYFNNSKGLEYEGDKQAIEQAFAEKYKSPVLKGETGLIRIRFVVNYKGETDRFRLMSMDEDYNEKTFLMSITDQLMEITKGLRGWKKKTYKGEAIDYYQYLIFKMEDGQIKEILP